MRDARPFLQIAHVGPWNIAAPEPLSLARRAAFSAGKSAIESLARHDPTAVLALRQWLEAVAVRDAVGRKLVTWLVETGSRTALGDHGSYAYARTLARSLALGTQHARVLCAGARDAHPASAAVDEQTLDARFGALHPSAPLTLRAPHGAFEVQLFAQDTERLTHSAALARTQSLREEYAPADRAPVLLFAAGFDHANAHARTGADAAWVLSSAGDDESVTATAAHGDAQAQTVALLRVYASASQRRAAIVERLLFARPLAMGPFRLLQSRTVERLISWA